MFETLATFINLLTEVLFFAILIRAILSWFMPGDASGIGRVLYDITEPVLAPIRRILPPLGGIDFSPIVGMVLIQVVGNILIQLLSQTG